MSHSRITSYPLYKQNNIGQLDLGRCFRAFLYGKRCSVRRPAWRVLITSYHPSLLNPITTREPTLTTSRIDNQNGGRGCRASKLSSSVPQTCTDIQVIDNGSGMCKAGFAGDDAPRAVFP
jgi:hypothetical protein